jgi:hypothetical protein
MTTAKTLCLIASLATASATAALPEPTGLSAALRAAPTEQADFALQATGVQIYVCNPKADNPNLYQWNFTAPEAALSESGQPVGTHGAGPTWESSSDRSSVKGTVRARQPGGTGNIPWLLLAGSSAEAEGRFARISSIQRVNTKGGVEPSEPCSETKAGQEVRVPYTADYYFYRRRP